MLGAAGAASSVETGVSARASVGPVSTCASAGLGSTRVIVPVRFTLISLIRLSRVINRGEPGGRLNPRVFSALANVSIVTERAGAR